MHLVNCKNPRLIRNRYTGEHMYVPCGCCSYCRMKYSLKWKSRLDQEFQDNHHAVFFTLTYRPSKVPLSYLNGNELYSDDWEETLDVSSILSLNDENSDYLLSRESFPFAVKRDIQLFIKRVRKECYKYDTEIRYYVCSEYGPKTYRPHYHGILFFDGERVTDKIREIIDSKWRLGFTDSKFAEKGAIDYVSSYVSGSVGLPLLYTLKAFKPFVLASRNRPIGFKYFSENNELDLFLQSSPTYIRKDKQGEHEEALPFYYRSKLFPKCLGFNTIGRSIRRVLYGLAFSENERKGRFEIEENPHLDEVRIRVHTYDNERYSRDISSGGYKVMKALALRVFKFCKENNLSLDNYLDNVELYHTRVDKILLNDQLEFAQHFSRNEDGDLSPLVHLFPFNMEKRNLEQSFYNIMTNYGYQFINLEPESYDFTDTHDFSEIIYVGDKFIEDCSRVKTHNDKKSYKHDKSLLGYTNAYFGSS